MADIGEFIAKLKFVFDGSGADEANKSMEGMSSKGSILDGIMSHFVITAGDVKDAVVKVAETVWSFAEAAGGAELAQKRLEDAMKAQGIYTADSLKSNVEYAQSLQLITKYDDEATEGAMTLLTTFGLHDEQLKRSTKAVQDLASGMGMDLDSAARLVGKSFEGNTTSLKKFGIIIDENIPASQKFEAVLQQLQSRFGGMAEGEAQTFLGSITKMRNSFEEVKETIGAQLLPVFGYWIDKLNTVFNWVQKVMNINKEADDTYGKSAKSKLGLLENEKIATQNLIATLEVKAKNGDKQAETELAQAETRLASIDKAVAFVRVKAVEELKSQQDKTDGVVKLSNMEVIIKEENAKKEATKKYEYDTAMLDYEIAVNKKSLDDRLKLQQSRLSSVQKGSKEEIAALSAVAATEKELSALAVEQTLKKIAAESKWAAWSINKHYEVLQSLRAKTVTGSAAYKTYTSELEKLDTERAQKFNELTNAMSSSFVSGMEMMRTGQGNLKQSMDKIWQGIGDFVIHKLEEMIAKAIIFQGIMAGLNALFPGSGMALGKLLSFDTGGVVPGAIGSPQLVMAHGGETILPTHKSLPSMMSSTNNVSNSQQGGTVININGSVDKDNVDEICRKIAASVKGGNVEAIRMTKVINKEGSARSTEAY